MKRLLVVLPLIVCACQAGWPVGSYSAVDSAQARTLTPAIAEFVSSELHGSEGPVSIDAASQGDEIGRLLPDALMRYGVMVSSSGQRVQYIAAPVDGGVLLRISVGNAIGSRMYVANGGSLSPAGPMTVATP